MTGVQTCALPIFVDPLQGATFLPAWADPYQLPQTAADLYQFLLDRGIPRYSTLAELQASYPAPADGKVGFAGGALYIRSGGAWVVMWQGAGVVRRETLTGVNAFVPAGGVTPTLRTAVIDHGADGSKAVSLVIEANAPYVSGVNVASWGSVVASLIPSARTPVAFTHTSNMGLGQITPAGVLQMNWGTFGSAGTTALSCSANYVIPGP